MDSKSRSRLSGALDAYDAKKRKLEEDNRRASDSRQTFLAEFTQHVSTTIRPALEEVAEFVRSRGHGAEVKVGHVQGRSLPDEAVSILLYPNNQRSTTSPATTTPYVTFAASPQEKAVEVFISTLTLDHGGSSGPRGKFALAELDAVQVEALVAEVVEKAFARDGY